MIKKIINMIKDFRGSAKRAAIFEIIHLPVDIGVVGLLTGQWTIAVGAVAIQHFVVFVLHTSYDRYSYDDYYNQNEVKDDRRIS